MAAGPTIANRISSADQAIGRKTVTRTARSVRAIIIPTNRKLPPLVEASGATSIAM